MKIKSDIPAELSAPERLFFNRAMIFMAVIVVAAIVYLFSGQYADTVPLWLALGSMVIGVGAAMVVQQLILRDHLVVWIVVPVFFALIAPLAAFQEWTGQSKQMAVVLAFIAVATFAKGMLESTGRRFFDDSGRLKSR